MNEILKKYGFPDSRDKSKIFLEKYYLTELSSSQVDKKIIDTLSNVDRIHDAEGGYLFDEKEFEQLLNFLRTIGENYFFLFELDSNNAFPLNFKFPTNLSWECFNSGGGISYEILRPIRKFAIVVDSNSWMRINDNDKITPIQKTFLNEKHETDYYSNFPSVQP